MLFIVLLRISAGFVRDFVAERRGAVAVEFSVIIPMLMIMTLGVSDATGALRSLQRTEVAANAIAEMVTNCASQNYMVMSTSCGSGAADPSVTQPANIISNQDAQNLMGAVKAYFPTASVLPTVVLTSVVFTPNGCTGSACSANVAWSTVLSGGDQSKQRPCGSLTASTTPGVGTLPPGVFGSAPVIVVDVYYTWTGVFLSAFKALQLQQHAFQSPRTGTDSDYVQYPPGMAACSGYL
jgi:Flp pilus assembly protein TadG